MNEHLERHRQQMKNEVGAAYAGLGVNRAENYFAWRTVVERWTRFILDVYAYEGWEQSPLEQVAFRRRLAPATPSRRPNDHIALLDALMTRAAPVALAHIHYRRSHDGNTVLGFTGMAGTGKSSAALGLIDATDPRGALPPEALPLHVVFEQIDLVETLHQLPRGSWALVDEDVTQTGEGARTNETVLDMIIDTFRKSGINLIQAAPRLEPDPRYHALYESVFWHPTAKKTLFLVHVENGPIGVHDLAWAREPVWAAYGPFKAENVERTLHGQFRSNKTLMRRAMRAFANPRYVNFLLRCANKPKKKDVETAYELIEPLVVATKQFSRLVDVVYTALVNYDRLRPEFEETFGVPASEGFVKVAQKCYEE